MGLEDDLFFPFLFGVSANFQGAILKFSGGVLIEFLNLTELIKGGILGRHFPY